MLKSRWKYNIFFCSSLSKIHQNNKSVMRFRGLQKGLEAFLTLRNTLWGKNWCKSERKLLPLVWCILVALWEAPNPPNMRYFQNLTCFSIFVIWTNPSSSECAKTIKKICRKQNFNLTLKFFEKKFLVASMSTFFHFFQLRSWF